MIEFFESDDIVVSVKIVVFMEFWCKFFEFFFGVFISWSYDFFLVFKIGFVVDLVYGWFIVICSCFLIKWYCFLDFCLNIDFKLNINEINYICCK